MNREMFAARPFQLAVGVLLLALALAGWTGLRASQVPPVDPAAPPVFATADALARPSMTVPVDIGAVVGANLFSADRTAPQKRYRLGGYSEPAPKPQGPQPVVLGTSVDGDRSFAFISVGDSGAKLKRVGDVLAGYTVKMIERGVVTFTTPSGELLVVRAPRL